MRDTARAAAMSDPQNNRQFRGPWIDPPPQTRKRQRRHPLAFSGHPKIDSNDIHTTSTQSAQRAVRHAARRVAQLQRRADTLAAIGLTDASLRLASLAATITAEVLA
jgi:hypothetical protein